MGLLDGISNVALALSSEEREILRKEAAKREELARKDPLSYGFPPHGAQLQIHRSSHQDILFVAANRIGKTTTGMREVLWRATHTHPYKKIRPHSTIWCGFPDFPFYRRTTLPMFRRWYPRDMLIEFDKQDKVARFRRSDGGECEVHFVSYESGRDKWQGAAVDLIWPDEEMPQDIYEEAIARLVDSGGDMLMTLTPVSGLGWTYDAIFVPYLQGKGTWEIVEGALAEHRPECVCGHQSEEHDRGGECQSFGCSCKRHEHAWELAVGPSLMPPGHPMSDRDKILRFARSIKDPDQRLIRIFGKYRARAGGVYKQYDPTIHLVPAFKVPSYWQIWGGIDPGFHGFAFVLMVQDPMGRNFVVYEYFSQGETSGARAREMWAGIQGAVDVAEDDYVPIYVDTEDPQTVLELNTWAYENGVRLAFTSLKQGSKAVMAGIQRVQEYLTPEKWRQTPLAVMRDRPEEGEPLLYFFDNLSSTWLSGDDSSSESRLVWELTRYLWKRKRAEGQVDEPDKASAGGAHMLDALRYGTMARLAPPVAPPEMEKDRGDPDRALDREMREHLEESHRRHMEAWEEE
jgi:phage terminase large subunit-like protein